MVYFCQKAFEVRKKGSESHFLNHYPINAVLSDLFLIEECLDNTSNTKQLRYARVITGPNGALSLHSCITPCNDTGVFHHNNIIGP